MTAYYGMEYGKSIVCEFQTNSAQRREDYLMKTKLKPGINDLQTMHPHTAAQWHPYKNGRLTPKEVCAYSGKKVWWQTEAERYGKLFTLEWDAVIANRANGCGCPYTSKPPKRLLKGFNDFQSTNPQTAALCIKAETVIQNRI